MFSLVNELILSPSYSSPYNWYDIWMNGKNLEEDRASEVYLSLGVSFQQPEVQPAGYSTV